MEMILSGSDLYLVYVAGHRLKSNLEACTSVWASVVISIPDCLRLMYLGYLNKYVCLRLRPKKKKPFSDQIDQTSPPSFGKACFST